MPHVDKKARKSFIKHFKELLEKLDPCEDVDLDHTIHLKSKKVCIPNPALPLQIWLGGEQGKQLMLYPELKFNHEGKLSRTDSYLIFDPNRFFSSISGFIRLLQGKSLMLGRESEEQNILLQYSKVVARQHLKLKLPGDVLILKDKSLERGTCIAPLSSKHEIKGLKHWRCENIERFIRLVSGKITATPKDQALSLINEVINSIENDPQQLPDSSSAPGGVVKLPDEMNVILIGDLHAKIDNLLVILTQNHFLQAIEEGKAALVILGDAVHPDEKGRETEMASSMLMMDLIFRLKAKFPHQIYYLRGNHDSFSEDISKHGVSQGLLWKNTLLQERGAEYVQAMERLYQVLPYVVMSKHFFSCHAGAPTGNISLQKLVDIRSYPLLEKQITTIRQHNPNKLGGYKQRDVKRLRKQLALDAHTPVIVGHTPMSDKDTVWWNVKEMNNHHILFGAQQDWIGVIVQSGEQTYPLRYPTEPLSSIINNM